MEPTAGSGAQDWVGHGFWGSREGTPAPHAPRPRASPRPQPSFTFRPKPATADGGPWSPAAHAANAPPHPTGGQGQVARSSKHTRLQRFSTEIRMQTQINSFFNNCCVLKQKYFGSIGLNKYIIKMIITSFLRCPKCPGTLVTTGPATASLGCAAHLGQGSSRRPPPSLPPSTQQTGGHQIPLTVSRTFRIKPKARNEASVRDTPPPAAPGSTQLTAAYNCAQSCTR